MNNNMKKQTIGHLASTLALPALLLLAAACTSELPTTLTGTPTDGSDALQALPPETPVAIGATTRSATTTDIPAWNELTDQTKIINPTLPVSTNGGVEKTGAKLVLPSASHFYHSVLTLGGDVPLSNLTGMTMTPSSNSENAPVLTALCLYHLNLNATDANGRPQCHSRLAIMEVGSADGNDFLYGVAKLSAPPSFNFRLRHASAKLSVLVTTTANTVVDMSEGTGVLNSASVQIYSTSVRTVYTGGSTSTPQHFPITEYLLNHTSTGSDQYPDDPNPETEIGVAIKGPTNPYISPKSYSLKHPTQVNAPMNLLSVILPASATHKDFGTYYAPLESPQSYTAKNVLKLVLNNIVDDGTPNAGSPDGGTGTYSLKLTDIVLTGLPEGDKRRDTDKDDGTGHLLYLLPGEHLTITVKVDRNRIVFATGTIGTWSEAGASEDLTGDETKRPAPTLIDTDIDGVRTYEVSTATALQNLAAWINGTGLDPITGEAASKTEQATRLKTNITLTDNIDLSTLPKKNGNNWTPIGVSDSNPYTGIFDGGGHTVSGLSINRTGSNDQGLFGCITGTVKNVTVEGYVTGSSYVGGVVGENYGRIENCTNRATVTGSSYVGGVVGNNKKTLIACYNTGTVRGTQSVGGVVGGNDTDTETTLIACYNTGTVTGGSGSVGGVVGEDDYFCSPTTSNTLIACYNTGTVTSNGNKTYVGALVGDNTNISLTACFYQWGSGVPEVGIGSGDGSGLVESTGSNILFSPVGNPGKDLESGKYDGTKTWDLVVGRYADDGSSISGGKPTMNKAIFDWNKNHPSGTAEHCPYKFVANEDEVIKGGNLDGSIPGGVGTTPLLLVPIKE